MPLHDKHPFWNFCFCNTGYFEHIEGQCQSWRGSDKWCDSFSEGVEGYHLLAKSKPWQLRNLQIHYKYRIPGSLRTVVPVWGDDDRGRWVGQGYTRGGRGTAPTPSTNLEQQNLFRIFVICSCCLLVAIERKGVWLLLIFVLPGRRDQHVAFYCWGWLCLLWALQK